jgi:chromate reductase, NAD(P)H dehydrogenase (quinone)
MDKPRDVAVIVGSLRKDSINRKVANALAELAPASGVHGKSTWRTSSCS